MGERIANGHVEPIITTTHGQVRGEWRETVYGDHFYCFDGIPYAKPPLGELRFKSPQPAEPWIGVRDCTEVAPRCIQYNRYMDCIEGSEDCLYLNVYAKKLKSEKPLPVLVYIHGGGFATGSASRLAWGPDYFMMKDVILVTIGYRLGALGFISFPEPELQVSGNAGLKDIVLALKWLKQNYHNFNGDPNNITLFGHSAGSIAAHAVTLSPQSEGLFHRAILLSGLITSMNRIKDLQFRFARLAGYEGPNNNEKILNYLSKIEADKLCNFKFFTPEELDQGRHYTFWPVVESSSVPDAILTEEPIDIFANEQTWSHKIPLLLSVVSKESLLRYAFFTKDPKLYDRIRGHPEYFLSLDVKWECDLETQKELGDKLLELHLDERGVVIENAMALIDLSSYETYHGVHRYLHTRLAHAQAPTYFFRFDFDSPDFNLYRIKQCGPGVRGVAHVDDLSYIFYMPESFKLSRDSAEFKTIERMMDLLTAFATNSDPNCESIRPLVWEPLASQGITRKCLNISEELSFIDWPESEKCKKWDQYYKEAGIRLF